METYKSARYYSPRTGEHEVRGFASVQDGPGQDWVVVNDNGRLRRYADLSAREQRLLIQRFCDAAFREAAPRLWRRVLREAK